MAARVLISLFVVAAPLCARADEATTAKVAAWVKSGCQYLTTNWRIGAVEAAPHFGRVLRVQHVTANNDRIFFAAEALSGWETSIENGTVVTISVPDREWITVGDFERHFGTAKLRVGDYRLRKRASKGRPRAPRSEPMSFEFARTGSEKLCAVIVETVGDPDDYRSQRVKKIEFID